MPLVSIVIPTLNAEIPLRACLAAIRSQSFGDYEIVIADGGSTDATLEIAKEFNVEKIVENKLKTGEAGKSAGIEAASGEIIALIDSDNILTDSDWLKKMLKPLVEDSEIIASEPLEYTYRKQDSALTRYFALLGMNDPICLFTGNYDRYCAITNRWTNLHVESHDCGDYLKLDLTPQTLPTIGANGFIFKRELLNGVNWTPYFFDIDILQQRTNSIVAKVKCGIVHLYCSDLKTFARKQHRRICDYLYFATTKQRTYDWEKQRKNGGIISFCIETILFFPLVFHILRGMKRKVDIAWLYHIPVCWITLFTYGKETILSKIRQPKAANRTKWKQ